MEIIKIKQFGKDHWSLLAYVEYRAINRAGVLSIEHLRTKNPALQQNRTATNLWKPEYGSKLYGYFNEDGRVNEKLRILDHDDHNCLDDLEESKLIKSFGSGLHPAYKLTKEGARVCGLLVLHKQEGKNYASFVLPVTDEKEKI